MHDFLAITFRDLLNPEFYIKNGGLWVLLFIVFAETGLMVGFFLPGDSLLFVAGIYSDMLVKSLIPGGTGSNFLDLMLLWVMISLCGVLGNVLGYWFGKKGGTYLFQRKDNFLFKKRYLLDAKNFYDKHGGQAIVFCAISTYHPHLRPDHRGYCRNGKEKIHVVQPAGMYFLGDAHAGRWSLSVVISSSQIQI